MRKRSHVHTDAIRRNHAARAVPSALDDACVRILFHVMDGRATVRSCAAAADMSVTATYERLWKLYDAGLVTWESNLSATFTALVRPVPMGAQ